MNKNKKIAMAVVATVMAGAMVVPFAACGPNNNNNNNNNGGGAKDRNLLDLPDKYDVVNDETGYVNYDSYAGNDGVTLNLSIGYENEITSTSFRVLGDEITLPDGNTYSDGMLKPAWAQLSSDLHIKFTDVWDGSKTSENLTNMNTSQTANRYSNVDLFTTDLNKVVAMADTMSFLNLADYLDYMPHYTAFLNQNPVVYLSLLQDGMKTKGDNAGSGQTLYIAPYFDGMDDIERYCLIRQDWTTKLLNGDEAATGSTNFDSNSVNVEPFMGDTGALAIESANADGSAKITIYKNYDNVLAQIKTANSALDTAYRAIAGASYTGTSGNIVAIQNAALKAGTANGAQLLTLFRAYIDACYTTGAAVGSSSYYTSATRANLFNGYDACWDVDDLVAMLRCIMTNKSAIAVKAGNDIGGITAREGNNNRTPDLMRLAGQLYGVRGTASATENFYIDNDGILHDARTDDAFYDAAIRMNQLFKEGLIVDCTASTSFTATGGIAEATYSKTGNPIECFMEYDYSQTQTQYGFHIQDPLVSGAPSYLDKTGGYNFAAIATPVSKWDVDGNGSIDLNNEVFRFTESWRTTKTSGVALNGALANDPAKLKAALQLVDYLYSEDGQIVSTYGPMVTGNSAKPDGFWSNEVQANPVETTYDENGEVLTTKNYFQYKGVKYAGTEYKDKITPTITQYLKDSFMKKEVFDWTVTDNSAVNGAGLSFTNYARYLIGSTLPVGVKDQSFESQLTSDDGKIGSDRVGVLLKLGVIKGMTLDIDEDNWWYTCVPSGLPISDEDNQQVLGVTAFTNYNHFFGDTKNSMGIMPWIIFFGTNSTYSSNGVTLAYSSIQDMLDSEIDKGSGYTVKRLTENLESVYSDAWETAKSYWTYLKPAD